MDILAHTDYGEIKFDTDNQINYAKEDNHDGTTKLSIRYDKYTLDGKIINAPAWLVFPHCHPDANSPLGYSCDSNDLREDRTIFKIIFPDAEITEKV